VAKYKKKRARELKQDRFRDTALSFFDRVGDRLEGKGRTILYAIGAALALAVIIALFNSWRARKSDEARQALGRAIEIAGGQVTTSPSPGSTTPTFPTEGARAQKAAEEFQEVAKKYGSRTEGLDARYLMATNLLITDHDKGIAQLEELTHSSDADVASLSKFALAQSKEADAKYDEAAALYSDLAKENRTIVPADSANLRLAEVYVKQGKKKEAADLFFKIVDDARKAKDTQGKPLPESAGAREASQQLEKVDPERYAQLPAAPPPAGLSF
jgi:tetratricopeptide (TPR) repeat protein